jgi:hypothetical protein
MYVLYCYVLVRMELRSSLCDLAAVRVQGAVQHLIYKKMLLLRSGGERVLGQVLTYCTNEQERLFEACHMGVLLLGKFHVPLSSI